MAWFPDSLLNIDMRDDDARTVRLHQETFWFKHIYFKSVYTMQYNFQTYKH